MQPTPVCPALLLLQLLLLLLQLLLLLLQLLLLLLLPRCSSNPIGRWQRGSMARRSPPVLPINALPVASAAAASDVAIAVAASDHHAAARQQRGSSLCARAVGRHICCSRSSPSRARNS